MQITGFILILAAGVIVFFGGGTAGSNTFPSTVFPSVADIRIQ